MFGRCRKRRLPGLAESQMAECQAELKVERQKLFAIARRKATLLICGTFGMTFILLLAACSKFPELHRKNTTAEPAPTQLSTIKVDVKGGGPVVLTTSAAEFQVTPDGYVQASLLKNGKRLSLDE